MKSSLAILALGVVARTASWGLPDRHGPFAPSEEPYAPAVAECVLVESIQNTRGPVRVYATGTNAATRIVVSQPPGDDLLGVRVETDSGERILEDTDIRGCRVHGVAVWSGLLNEDQLPDYVVKAGGGGCGLAGDLAHVSFLLSAENSYRVVPARTFFAAPSDFIDVDHDGKAEFIHTAFVYGEQGEDGKRHNYWVYNLLEFENDRIVSANDLDDRFPAWVWYTLDDNHKNTTQLTNGQRLRLWQAQAATLFPEAEALAGEQAR